MKPAEITQTIVHYLADRFESLPDTMPFEGYFLVKGATMDEVYRHSPKIVSGTAIDILADAIEKDHFFGWYVNSSVSSATNERNVQLVPLEDGSKVSGEFSVKLSEEGLFLVTERIGPKGYLDILRTTEGFKQSANLLGVEGDLERITSTLYKS